MSVFLAVYANAQDTTRYKESNNEDDIVINEKRQKIVYIMDTILIQMNNAEMQDSGMNTDLATFYTNIKRMSLENIQSSNNLVEHKREVETLQNNLANYNNMQNLNYRSKQSSQVSLLVNAVVWSVVLVFVVGSTLLQNTAKWYTDIVAVAAVVFVVLYWMGVFRWTWRFTSENIKQFLKDSKKT
jgi:cation transport ATPase